jgi:hypothetical protein
MKKNVTWVPFLFVLSQRCQIKPTYVGCFSSSPFLFEKQNASEAASVSVTWETYESYCHMSVVLSKSLSLDRNVMLTEYEALGNTPRYVWRQLTRGCQIA